MMFAFIQVSAGPDYRRGGRGEYGEVRQANELNLFGNLYHSVHVYHFKFEKQKDFVRAV